MLHRQVRLDFAVRALGILAMLAAALLWLWASSIDVPNNIDTIVGELQWAGRLNAYAAICAAVGSLCVIYEFAREWWF